MGRQENSNHHRKRVNHPYCPFNKFCIFLHGKDPDSVLTERAYLCKRVDELEFGMDFTNYQVRELCLRLRSLILKPNCPRCSRHLSINTRRKSRLNTHKNAVLRSVIRDGFVFRPSENCLICRELLPGSVCQTCFVFFWSHSFYSTFPS